MKIVVLAGGLSEERDVSLSSGAMIAAALKRCGHDVALMDLFFGAQSLPLDPFSMDITPIAVASAIPNLKQIAAQRVGGMGSIGDGVIELCKEADIVFLGLHGADGENGRLQAMFDMLGIKYTGSGYLASALAMNKHIAKTIFDSHGISTAKSVTLTKSQPVPDIEFPCVVKPCSGGSSIGVSVVTCKEELPCALETGFSCEDELLIEEFVHGREISIAVLGGKALPAIEICPKHGYYDYVNKYQPGFAYEICPAKIPDDVAKQMLNTAEAVYNILGLSVYARIDFILRRDGSFVCLEANTLPGMTPTSLVPQEAMAVGMSYEDLCMTIVNKSLEKYSK